MNWVRRFIARLWNPWLVRDEKGRIIDDWPRRKDIKRTKEAIRQGRLKMGQKDYQNQGKRSYKVETGGNIKMSGGTK